MKCVIFTGPTLSKEEAQPWLEAIYLPPARQGDIISAIFTHMPDIIGIIDGASYPDLEVWHRELLYALENGIAVYGSSSIGALRAAELDIHGMQGVGKIYEGLKGIEVSDDDEVMCHYECSGSHRRISEPLANIRATFEALHRERLIDGKLVATLPALAKSLHYRKRTFQAILEKARNAGVLSEKQAEELLNHTRSCYVDLQKEDAIELLKAVKKAMETGGRAPYGKIVDRSDDLIFHVAKYRDRTISRDGEGEGLPLFSLVDYMVLTHPEADELAVSAKNRFLAGVLADMLHVEASDRETGEEALTFRTRYGLEDQERFGEWLAENDLVEEEFRRLMEQNAKMKALHDWLRDKLGQRKFTRVITDELMLTDQYSRWVGKALLAEKLYQERREYGEELLSIEAPEKLVRDHVAGAPREWHRIFRKVMEGMEITDIMLKHQLVKARIERETLEKALLRHLEPAAHE
ncbi:MAG: TfuA-like protein [Candidatus Eremiobacteraeota bacterium]|nr:TfuA-like protein [Candidatus Eremiobacteraeota bacterium]